MASIGLAHTGALHYHETIGTFETHYRGSNAESSRILSLALAAEHETVYLGPDAYLSRSPGSHSHSHSPLIRRTHHTETEAHVSNYATVAPPPVNLTVNLDPEKQVEPEVVAKRTSLRWLVLVLASALLWGRNYAYDSPAPVTKELSDHLSLSDFQFNLLYSVYSTPNVILPFLGGYWVDRYGTSKTMTIFALLCVAGAFLVAVGVQSKSYMMVLAGRVLFGLGGESLSVAQAKVVALWFQGAEFAMALGVNLCVERLGSVATENFSPWIASSYSVEWVFWLGFGASTLCIICAILLVMLANCSHISGAAEQEYPIRLPDILRLSKQFWLVCFIICLLYGTVIPFNIIESKFLQDKWYPGDSEDAGRVMSIPDTISAVSAPVWGLAVDKLGFQGWWTVFTAVIIMGIHCGLGLMTLSSPIFFLILLGCAYAVYSSAVWPAVATVTPESLWGLAYGVATAALNASCALFPIIVAIITPPDGRADLWWHVSLFFAGLAATAFFAGLLLNWLDHNDLRVLNLPEAQRQERLKKLAKEGKVAIPAVSEVHEDFTEAVRNPQRTVGIASCGVPKNGCARGRAE
eukprot:TRINITY_DN4896_c0_g1_i2.p1 TRINITY_DN4896_c0_g1~~TRINITY_DN4896_c0_g1_i2.p1  ORF type:complete len:586 (-),score=68.17 TRINITY_DN4896_c0_g1_i2:192-1925(-)